MSKLDITNVPRELDQLIRSSKSGRHRRILENVRRHYLLELTGRPDEILAPDMTVEDPVYYIDLDGTSRTLRGRAAVRDFYGELEGVVFACEDTTHAVTDTGYWFESWFNFYLPAAAIGLDGSAWYVKRQWVTMRWPYDEGCRMIGERVYDHPDITTILPVDESDVITFAEAKKLLEPLIRPLPAA
ncbi:hypothetical protein ACTMTJ_42475 [Phytohabitans sp. LJ34]|uniref:hypothetical protein n=1 Tax=Phytohabitans sp. LJ34 TaxID=3452217 RepID=UPI003F8C734D